MIAGVSRLHSAPAARGVLTRRDAQRNFQQTRINRWEQSDEMYESSTLQANDHSEGKSDRPEFEVRIKRPPVACRRYQVIAFTPGILLLDLGPPKAQAGDGNTAMICGILGGLVGAYLGAALEGAMESQSANLDSSYARYSDDQLIQIARGRKHSMVALYDDIESASIDAPSTMDKIYRGRGLVGWISLHEKTLGKLKMEVRDLSSMAMAMKILPSRLGDRAKVNVEFDDEHCVFVRKRPSSTPDLPIDGVR